MNKSSCCLLWALLLLSFTQLSAQDPAKLALLESTTPAERASVQTELLQEELQLEQAQRTLLHQINLKYARKMEKVIKGKDSKWRKYRIAKRFEREKDQELQQLLSSSQYATYLGYKDQLKEDGKDRLLELRKE